MNSTNTTPPPYVKGTKKDWPRLKHEFVTGNFTTVREFLATKGIPFMNYPAISGWATERRNYQEKVLAQAEKRTEAAEVESLSDVRIRQARLARFLQLKGAERMKEIKNINDVDIDEARKMVITGLEQERKALGMEGGNQNLTQININSGIKTNLDKMIEGMDYEQTLELVAELKRIRAGRAVSEASGSSTSKAEEGEVL